jgi:hypothetical protein
LKRLQPVLDIECNSRSELLDATKELVCYFRLREPRQEVPDFRFTSLNVDGR